MLTDFMSLEFGKDNVAMAYLYFNEDWGLGPWLKRLNNRVTGEVGEEES